MIPCNGVRGSRWAFGSVQDVLLEAETLARDRECQVLVVSHEPGGLIRPIATVGEKPKPRKREPVVA